MAEGVDNLVLEQLRLIRETLGQMQGEMRSMRGDIEDLSGKVLANTTVVMSLAMYIGAMNQRVEHIEDHLGIAR